MDSSNQQFKRRPGEYAIEQAKKQEETKLKKDLEELTAFVSSMQSNLLKNVTSPVKKEEISSSIQLLIFHYLGFLEFEGLTNKNKAVLLSVIFNSVGAENIRKRLSNVGGKGSSLLTEKNLKFIEGLFEKIGLSEPLKKVKKDISKLTNSKE